MLKVLSTKLAADEADHFNVAAEQQGLTKAGLLKRLVKEYLGGSIEESKASGNSKQGISCSLEKRQTPDDDNRGSLQLEKQKALQTGKLEKSFSHLYQTDMVQNVAHRASTDKTPMGSFDTAIDAQVKASLRKAFDSKEIIIKAPSVAQGFLKVRAKTQTKPKVGSGELLFFGLMALGIVLTSKCNNNKMALSEPNYTGYPDNNEDVVIPYW